MIIFLSVNVLTIFFSMKLLIGYLTRFLLEMEGADGQEYVCNGGGCSKCTSAYNGGKVSILCHFGAYVLIE